MLVVKGKQCLHHSVFYDIISSLLLKCMCDKVLKVIRRTVDVQKRIEIITYGVEHYLCVYICTESLLLQVISGRHLVSLVVCLYCTMWEELLVELLGGLYL